MAHIQFHDLVKLIDEKIDEIQNKPDKGDQDAEAMEALGQARNIVTDTCGKGGCPSYVFC